MENQKKMNTVRMVRRICDAHHDELDGATREKRIAFYNSKVRPAAGGTKLKRGRVRKSAV